MSVKQQLPTLSLLYSIYEDVPEQTLDETDVDSYFYYNILDITKTDNRLVRVSNKGYNKNLFAIKVFKFCDLKAQQRFFLDEEISITKKLLAATLNRLRHFLKQYDHARKATLYPLPKPLQEIGFTLWKDELFSHYYLDIKEHTKDSIKRCWYLYIQSQDDKGLRTRTKVTNRKRRRNGISTTIPEKKPTNQRTEEPPAKKNKSI